MGGGDPGGPWKSNACDERLGSTTPKSSSHLDELCPCRWRVIPRALTHYTWGAAAAFRLLNTGGTCNSLQRGGTEALIQRALMPAGDELPKLQVDLRKGQEDVSVIGCMFIPGLPNSRQDHLHFACHPLF